MTDGNPTRRERLRAQTLDEIRDRGLAAVDRHGAQALSLAALAKELGVSAPALYRYFPSRDALIADLVTASYGQLADACRTAGEGARRRAPPRRLQAVAEAYRAWAVAHPRRYAMLFGEPTGAPDDDAAVATIHGGMEALLEPLVALAAADDEADGRAAGAGGHARRGAASPLDRQLRAWAVLRGTVGVADPAVLRLGVLTWTRLHGLVGLELSGALAAMGLDPLLLLRAELDDVVRAARPSG